MVLKVYNIGNEWLEAFCVKRLHLICEMESRTGHDEDTNKLMMFSFNKENVKLLLWGFNRVAIDG